MTAAHRHRGPFLRAIVIGRDDQTGRIVCRIIDALDTAHDFVGAAADLGLAETTGPLPLSRQASIPCEVLARRLVEGRELVQVDTELDQGGVTSTEGLSWFMVAPEQLVTAEEAKRAGATP